MKWIELREPEQLEEIRRASKDTTVLIFKHSTHCSTSRLVLDRLQRNWCDEEVGIVRPYFLDLISYRGISNSISDEYQVPHESPQVLIIKNGISSVDFSHFEIDYKNIREVLKS